MPEGWLKRRKHARKPGVEEAYSNSEVKVDGRFFLSPNYTQYIFHLSHSRAQTGP